MCVFDPSSLTLCSPLVPITVTYSPIATPATALCHPGLPPPPQLPSTHHHQFHHHITTTTLQAHPHPHPPPTPLPANTSAVTPAATATPTTINSTSHHHQTTTTIIPLSLQPPVPPPPPVLTTLIPPSSTTTGYYIQPPPPPPPPTLSAATILTSSPASSPINVCPPLVKPSPWNQSYGMEHVWMAHFTSLFKSYPHQWCLLPVEQRPLGGNFTTFVDSAKVRFCCEECGHGWTSMKGRVAFWFDLTNYTGFPQGLVAFKLFGQQCQKCKSEMYEAPMWYPEEVFKVLVNLFNRVGQNYYGFYYPPLEKTRRAGKPRTPHNSQLCQACKDGVCTNRK